MVFLLLKYHKMQQILYNMSYKYYMVKMNHHNNCPKCGRKMTKIPIKKLDTTMIIELYCEKCDKSITFYPKINEVKFKQASVF